jgi:hypothetical protein
MSGTNAVWAANALDLLTGRAIARTTTRNTYLALLTADPGSPLTDASTLAEITTPGYARQQVVWTAPSGTPMTTQNSALLFYGPFTADMTDAASYAALVSAATGTTGVDVMYVWPIASPMLAVTAESLQIAAGLLTLNGS